MNWDNMNHLEIDLKNLVNKAPTVVNENPNIDSRRVYEYIKS
ncbi:hypothetical protein PYL56_04410 [Staphylococcus succinus]|nr:hypothetical protein [Staphylococcus succinus]MDH9160602.1 hypothetical protein [Staphylococcus succinus]